MLVLHECQHIVQGKFSGQFPKDPVLYALMD